MTAYPANVQVIHADGKSSFPVCVGLWRSVWYQNELLLSHGITSETVWAPENRQDPRDVNNGSFSHHGAGLRWKSVFAADRAVRPRCDGL
jgi:hypothetical protein